MLLAQGWKDKKVFCLVLSRATNGFEGWQIYRGSYRPSMDETYEQAQWECLESSQKLVDLLYYTVFPEIATWADGDKSVKNLQDILIAIHGQCQQIASYVGKACVPSSPS